MDFSAKFDDLLQRVADAKAAAQTAATESRDQLKQRIHQAQDDVEVAVESTKQQAGVAADEARSKWTQMTADAAAQRDDINAKINKRTRELDAKAAAKEADWAESDTFAAIDYSAWTVYMARLAALDAIDARLYADERANDAASQ
jgi:predicted transglutaminase-like cysteine proteinase